MKKLKDILWYLPAIFSILSALTVIVSFIGIIITAFIGSETAGIIFGILFMISLVSTAVSMVI